MWGVSSRDPATFAIVSGVLMLVALTASLVPGMILHAVSNGCLIAAVALAR